MKDTNPKTEQRLAMGKNFCPQHFSLYRACLANAEDLTDEAKTLAENGRYARAFALAFTAAEEIGKALVVADWVYGLVPEEVFRDAFVKHDVKQSHFDTIFSAAYGEPEHNSKAIREDFKRRLSALYVAKANDGSPLVPQDAVSEEHALQMIAQVEERLTSIISAEWLNPPLIGSKALLK